MSAIASPFLGPNRCHPRSSQVAIGR